tara:strand:+ start:226 stop:546 length:321 start_codon:yes stop_codon:yes gene_type:complete
MEGTEENKVIQLNGFLDAYNKIDFYKRKVEEIRLKRNTMLQKTDYLLLPDSKIYNDEIELNKVKTYRQELRDFMNKLMIEQIDTNIFLDIEEYADKYFPKLDTITL